jgi:hypothetical protein
MRSTRLPLLLAITFALASFTYAATTFSKKSYHTGNSPSAVVSADINRDGHPDLIAGNANSSGGFLAVMLGASGGTFTISANYPTTSNPVDVVAGDYNSDGFPDIMVLEKDGYQLFFSAKNGALLPQIETKFGCDGCVGTNILAIDLNRDRIPDIAYTVCLNGKCGLATDVNDGTGRFIHGGQSTGLDQFAPPHSLVAADFNRDSFDDLAVAVGTEIEIFRSNGGGGFSPLQTIPSPIHTQTFALAAGDIDAKNGPDLVFASSPTCLPECIASPTIYVYLNNGSGTLSGHANYTPAGESSLDALLLIDLTGDNRLDLVALNGALQENNGSIAWAHYTGSGNFGTFATLVQLGNPLDVIGRDLNLDSRHDLAVSDAGVPFATPAVVVLTNTTSNAAICTPPSSAKLAAKLCSPKSSTSSRTFTVKAAGNSPTGVRRVELWIDGQKKYNSPDDRLSAVITLSSGTHKFEIVAVDQLGAIAKTAKTVTVP